MAVYIVARRMEGGSGHEHIASVRWRNPDSGDTGASRRDQMVAWIENDGDARVADGNSFVRVGVVKATVPYIRTYKDGVWTNNLLALPTY